MVIFDVSDNHIKRGSLKIRLWLTAFIDLFPPTRPCLTSWKTSTTCWEPSGHETGPRESPIAIYEDHRSSPGIPSRAGFTAARLDGTPLHLSYRRFAISLSLRRADARCRGERNTAFRPARSCSKTALTCTECALGLSFCARVRYSPVGGCSDLPTATSTDRHRDPEIPNTSIDPRPIVGDARLPRYRPRTCASPMSVDEDRRSNLGSLDVLAGDFRESRSIAADREDSRASFPRHGSPTKPMGLLSVGAHGVSSAGTDVRD